jgi:exopolysaccharide biosynthesis polyprenyl glycosylphosphotransferase
VTNAEAFVEEVGLNTPSALRSPRGRVVRSKYRDRDFTLRRALLVADCLGLWIALAAALTIAGHRQMPIAASLWLLPFLPVWILLFRSYSLYKHPIRRFEPTHLDDISSLFHVLIVGTLGLWLTYKILPPEQLNFDEIVIFGAVALPLIALLRAALRIVNLRVQGPERVFAVAPLEEVMTLQRKLRNHPEYEMSLVGALEEEGTAEELGLPVSAKLEEIQSLIASQQIDHLIVQLNAEYMPQDQVVELMRACYREGIRFGAFPREKTLLFPGVEIDHIEGMGLLSYHPPVLSRSSQALKRILDVFCSAVLLVLFAPVMAAIAIAIKLDSKGPVFYRQMRVGKDGHRFRLLKFRSMVPDADKQTAKLMEESLDPDWLIMEEDPRITRVGRFLRRSSLDELPQLWNVLIGEMSMVGPRPLSELDDKAVLGWAQHRLDLMPGITGYWQILGRNSIPFKEMLEIDYAYVATWSMLHDIKILFRTVPAVLLRRGAN